MMEVIPILTMQRFLCMQRNKITRADRTHFTTKKYSYPCLMRVSIKGLIYSAPLLKW